MTIPVFFSDHMVADSKSASPSSAKPPLVVQDWLSNFPGTLEIREPVPVTEDQIKKVHNTEMVRLILAGCKPNGFGNTCPIIAATLPWTSGAMLSAAKEALLNRKVAVAPVSGFHHATTHEPMGFCTFNGLMITAIALRDQGLAKRVGILDFDCHYGNGTDEIIRTQGIDWVTHYTAGSVYVDRYQAPDFFRRLPKILRMFDGCDVVLYQAGADPHMDDPYGGWLTTEELQTRDGIVFQHFRDKSIPVAWNLAGGYQVEPDGSIPKILEIHTNTMRECVFAYEWTKL